MSLKLSRFKVGTAILFCALGFFINSVHAWQSDNGNGTFSNPVLYADYPDPDIIRVTNEFYMVSTTFVDTPGITVLHSKDMVNWEIVSHCATNLDGGNAYDMIGGTAYQSGYWASSIRFRNGTFYVAAQPNFSNGRIYYATNAAGPWQYHQLNQNIYDPGLFIDTDGTGYVVHGHGPQSIATLNANYSQVVAVSNNVVNSGGEGSHLVKRESYYYLFNANPGTWPFQLRCSRATNIFGPWETGRICLTATTGGHQGAIVDINDSDQWFGFVHQDSGSIGRMPRIGPVFWENNWPVFGTIAARDQMAASYTKPVAGQPIVQPATSDDFSNSTLGLQWQWNHNPDNSRWSLTERPGYLRLKPTLATNFWVARNTLTQKGQGPQSYGIVQFDLSNLQSGDVAGFGTLGKVSAHIAVSIGAGGAKKLTTRMIKDTVGSYAWDTGVTLPGNTLYLRTDLNFTNNLGVCSYSTNGTTWTKLGGNFELMWGYGSTFQGEKFAIFCYNTSTASSTGYVDVDSFTFGETAPLVTVQRGRPKPNSARTTFIADNGQPLRGPYTSTEWTSAAPYDQIAKAKTLGFNAVHLYAEVFDPNYPNPGSTAPGYNAAEVDKIVQSTRDLGLYLIMTIGNGANNGNHNIRWATNFWNLYAQRYANETHVLFEIHNEPVAWGPSYVTATTPPGAMNMEIAAYKAIRARAPQTPVLLFSYAVLSGNGGANDALTDIRAFNQSVFGNQNAVWTNEAVAFHGYGGWEGTATAVAGLINAGYPCFMTEFGWPRWGKSRGVALEVELTTDLERLGVSWLTFQYIPPSGVSDDVTRPELFKNVVDNAGLSWTPDYGSWPVARGVYGNNGQPRAAVANWGNDFLSGTLRIQAEDFDWGGEGVSCHDSDSANNGGQYRPAEPVDISACNDTGGGYKVAWTADGEWLEYTILVREPGMYDLRLRYATPNSGCSVEVISNARDTTGPRMLAATGGYTTWATATVQVYLGYGRQKVRLQIPTGGFDLNWIELSPASTGVIANGNYKILNAANAFAMQAVTTNNTVIATGNSGAASQQWNVQHMGGGQYKITSAVNGWSWNASGDALGLVSSWSTSGDRCFILLPSSGGFNRLIVAGSGLCLNTDPTNSSPVEKQEFSGSATLQQWTLVSPSSPAFPSGLSATALSSTQVALAWNSVAGATSYNVKRSTSSGGPYTTVAAGLTATNFTDIVIAGTKYYYVVSAVSGGAESPNSLEVSIDPPYPWASRDIGSVGVAGNVSFTDGVFTVGGSGADIWGTADAFRLVYVPVTGNCTITARVLSVQNTDGWAKAGVMIRASLNANSAHAFVAVTPGNGVAWQFRSTTGGNSSNNNTPGLNAPYWVRLVRSGNTFTGFRSADGVTWTQIGSTTISMGSTAYVGLALTSHNNSSLCTAAFDNVAVPGWQNVTVPPAPTGLTALGAGAKVDLAWMTSSNASSYNIKRAVTDGGAYVVIANTSATNFSDTNLVNGVAYTYVVSALNIAGESANSGSASVPAQFFTPTGLSVTPISATQMHLVWNAFTNAASYNVKRSPTSGGPYTTIATGVTSTNFTDTVAAGMKYFYVVSALVGGDESSNSAEATFNLPYPWQTQDVGSIGLAGSATFSNGVFTAIGSGDDIWNAADAFRFVYVPVTGNCTVTARVLGVQNTDPWAKAGVMIRGTLSANSVNAMVAVTPGNGVTFQTRSTTGGNSAFNNTVGLNAPYWVRLVRSGNTFTAYRSPDGVNWTQQGSPTTVSMASPVYVGLVVTAHNNSSLCTATFDNVTVPGWSNWTIPAAPTDLTATDGDAAATLAWTDSSGATSYNVKRAAVSGGPYTIITNVSSTAYTDTGLSNGTTYYYVVSVLNPAGESANSAQASATPQSPPNLSIAHTETNLTLSWPVGSTGFTLQSCTNLAVGNWENVTTPGPELAGDQWRIVVPLTSDSPSVFFRLLK